MTPEDIDPSKHCVYPDTTIREAVERINKNAKGIALVVDDGLRLLGTVVDGDIRRAILDNIDLEEPVSKILERKEGSPYAEPVTAPVGSSREELLELMDRYGVEQIPLVDAERHVREIVIQKELLPSGDLPVHAVVMAGGKGIRLRPLTEDTPKPMLPIQDRPLLEYILEQLRKAGIRKVTVTTNYLDGKIKEHFGDGSEFGVDLSFVDESQPLGTAGSLGLVEEASDPLLVINGDILTQVDFSAMFDFHREHGAELTIGLTEYHLEVPYGVVKTTGAVVEDLREKPEHSFLVNAGIYILSPEVHSWIRGDRRLEMTEVIDQLLRKDERVVGFPIWEYWLDIGHHEDYERAQMDVGTGRFPR